MQYLTISAARDAMSISCFREAEDSNRVRLTYPCLRADEFASELSHDCQGWRMPGIYGSHPILVSSLDLIHTISPNHHFTRTIDVEAVRISAE